MKLNGAVLLEALQARFKLEGGRVLPDELLLKRPQFYLEGQRPESGGLYLTANPQAALCRGDILTIYADGAQPARPGGNYISLQAPLGAVFNAVQAIFDDFDAWDDRLRQALRQQGGLQKLLRIGREMLKNPVMVMGRNFSVIAQDGEEELPYEQRVLDGQSDSMEMFNAMKQDVLYRQMSESTRPYLYPAHILGWRSWNVNIFRDGRMHFRLVLVEGKRKLCPGDGWLLEWMAPYVDTLLQQEPMDTQVDNQLRNLFQQILSDRTADPVDISRQLSQLGWGAEDAYLCLVLKSAEVSGDSVFIRQICDHMKKTYPWSCNCIYGGKIVVYFNLSRAGIDKDEICDQIKYFVREMLLKAGYSRAMKGHENLRRMYVQAEITLDIGGRVNPFMWIHHFENVSLDYLLEECIRRLPCSMVCHEKLLQLQKMDAAQGSEYIKTLRMYLDKNLNAMECARALFIHRSTLLYRLVKIREILGTELKEPDELLYLAISLRIMEASTTQQGASRQIYEMTDLNQL